MSLPDQIGAYKIDRELGRGGMGVVYLAHDASLNRPVAIKVLPEHVADDEERLARFSREARTLASLNHPNVAGIYGVEEQEGQRYLVLEFVEGESLAERLDRGPLDPRASVAPGGAAGVVTRRGPVGAGPGGEREGWGEEERTEGEETKRSAHPSLISIPAGGDKSRGRSASISGSRPSADRR